MTAEDLYGVTHQVLDFVGYPAWTDVDDPNAREELAFLAAEGDEPAQWALMPVGEEGPEECDCLAIGVDMAGALIREYLCGVLHRRGWQAQVSVRKDRCRWRLVDCLSPADGGGDRLGDGVMYPQGDDELAVLCESVRVVVGGV